MEPPDPTLDGKAEAGEVDVELPQNLQDVLAVVVARILTAAEEAEQKRKADFAADQRRREDRQREADAEFAEFDVARQHSVRLLGGRVHHHQGALGYRQVIPRFDGVLTFVTLVVENAVPGEMSTRVNDHRELEFQIDLMKFLRRMGGIPEGVLRNFQAGTFHSVVGKVAMNDLGDPDHIDVFHLGPGTRY